MTVSFNGLIPPMISPLMPNGEVDSAGLDTHVNRLIDGGVDGIFVLGTSGEGPLLTPSQAQGIIRLTVEAAAGRVPVLAGVLEPSTVRTVEAARAAADCGADAVVVTTPYYVEADADGIRQHFVQAADRSPVPVVLYNIPSKTHHYLTPDIVAVLVEHPNVVGIKDSHGDWAVFEQLLALRRPDFTILQGAERWMAKSMLAGADGVVPGLGNVVPSLFTALIAAARAGDEAGTLVIQEQVDALGKLHSLGHWLACLKYAVSRVSPTHTMATISAAPLTDDARAAIDALLAAQPVN